MNRRGFLALVGLSVSAGYGSLPVLGEPDSPSCPPFPAERQERDGQTICDGKARNAPVYLHATRETVSASGGRIDFAFVNESDEGVSYGPCFWTLYKQSTDGWQTIRPARGNAVGKTLPAHSSQELTLRTGQQDTTATQCNPYSVAALHAGRYLFGIQGHTPDGTTTQFLTAFRAER